MRCGDDGVQEEGELKAGRQAVEPDVVAGVGTDDKAWNLLHTPGRGVLLVAVEVFDLEVDLRR